MNIKGNKTKVNKTQEELYKYLLVPANFKALMPENVSVFEANEQGFTFALKGMPEVALRLSEHQEFSFVDYASAKSSLDFNLHLGIFEGETVDNSFVEIDFIGNFNPMIQFMVEKPLKNFIATLEQNIGKL